MSYDFEERRLWRLLVLSFVLLSTYSSLFGFHSSRLFYPKIWQRGRLLGSWLSTFCGNESFARCPRCPDMLVRHHSVPIVSFGESLFVRDISEDFIEDYISVACSPRSDVSRSSWSRLLIVRFLNIVGEAILGNIVYGSWFSCEDNLWSLLLTCGPRLQKSPLGFFAYIKELALSSAGHKP